MSQSCGATRVLDEAARAAEAFSVPGRLHRQVVQKESFVCGPSIGVVLLTLEEDRYRWPLQVRNHPRECSPSNHDSRLRPTRWNFHDVREHNPGTPFLVSGPSAG